MQHCENSACQVRLTREQMLGYAAMLVQQHRLDEAQPLIDALAQAPGLTMEAQYLAGYAAVERGDLKAAVKHFRASLAVDPRQTRVRLELARALMLEGRDGSADYHFRLAQQDKSLTAEIRATVQAQRGILRDRRPWHLSTEFGFAPDSNINNGTSAQTVDVVVGNQTLPLTLNDAARRRSGLGQTASISAGWRFRTGERSAFLVDGDGQGTNYPGTAFDDYTAQIAAGPEFRPSDETSLSLQAVGLRRWYGGQQAVTQLGGRLGFQRNLDDGQRIGATLDLRHATSGFGPAYSGWNLALYATYERIIARSLIASASLFARTDKLNEAAYSNRELGATLGIGGELAHGINAGLSGTVSRALYDAFMAALSPDPRRDWRLSARLYVGVRSVRLLGFSPSISYSYSNIDSSLALYRNTRSRFAFALARYF